jgi:16S rRNA processing protein RimM
MKNEFIPVGKIVKTHGTKGNVKVLLLSDIPHRLKTSTSIYHRVNDHLHKLTISYCRFNKNFAIIGFDGIDTLSSAKKLIGSTLEIKEEELAPLPENKYYIHTLIGFEVLNKEKKRIGTLKEIWQLPANDVFVVENEEEEMLFPSIKEAILSISIDKREMMVNTDLGVK